MSAVRDVIRDILVQEGQTDFQRITFENADFRSNSDLSDLVIVEGVNGMRSVSQSLSRGLASRGIKVDSDGPVIVGYASGDLEEVRIALSPFHRDLLLSDPETNRY